MKQQKEVSIIIIFRNEEKYISQCIKSILNQTYKDFELVLVNDASTDGSKGIVLGFRDNRLEYYENDEALGIPKTRNIGLDKAKGKYVFFTDADCFVDKNWIKEGLNGLRKGFAGVEGKTFYMNKNPRMSNRVVQQLNGGQWGTNNVAYDLEFIKAIGGFREKFKLGSDRDLGLRATKKRPLYFNKNMLAYHEIKNWTPKTIVNFLRTHAVSKVYLIKDHNDGASRFYFVVHPKHWVGIICPPAFFLGMMLKYRVKDRYDLKILFVYYLALFIERYNIWKTAGEERIFLI